MVFKLLIIRWSVCVVINSNTYDLRAEHARGLCVGY